jgi:hypothetical protein
MVEGNGRIGCIRVERKGGCVDVGGDCVGKTGKREWTGRELVEAS